VSTVLYTPDGAVIPPRDQVDLLEAIDRRLGLQFHAGLSCFVVALRWAQDDPRRGADAWAVETGHDWSIEVQIPPNVPLDEMASWALRKMSRGGSEGAGLVEANQRRVERANAARLTTIADGVRDEALSVDVTGPTIQPGKRRTRVKVGAP
jgi:hypothetical protein